MPIHGTRCYPVSRTLKRALFKADFESLSCVRLDWVQDLDRYISQNAGQHDIDKLQHDVWQLVDVIRNGAQVQLYQQTGRTGIVLVNAVPKRFSLRLLLNETCKIAIVARKQHVTLQ